MLSSPIGIETRGREREVHTLSLSLNFGKKKERSRLQRGDIYTLVADQRENKHPCPHNRLWRQRDRKAFRYTERILRD